MFMVAGLIVQKHAGCSWEEFVERRFFTPLGMNEIGFSWVMSIVFLVLVVQACVFPLFYKSMKGMRKMQAQMATEGL